MKIINQNSASSLLLWHLSVCMFIPLPTLSQDYATADFVFDVPYSIDHVSSPSAPWAAQMLVSAKIHCFVATSEFGNPDEEPGYPSGASEEGLLSYIVPSGDGRIIGHAAYEIEQPGDNTAVLSINLNDGEPRSSATHYACALAVQSKNELGSTTSRSWCFPQYFTDYSDALHRAFKQCFQASRIENLNYIAKGAIPNE